MIPGVKAKARSQVVGPEPVGQDRPGRLSTLSWLVPASPGRLPTTGKTCPRPPRFGPYICEGLKEQRKGLTTGVCGTTSSRTRAWLSQA